MKLFVELITREYTLARARVRSALAMEAAGDGHKPAASTVKKNRKPSKLRPAPVASSDVPKVRVSANCEKRDRERGAGGR